MGGVGSGVSGEQALPVTTSNNISASAASTLFFNVYRVAQLYKNRRSAPLTLQRDTS